MREYTTQSLMNVYGGGSIVTEKVKVEISFKTYIRTEVAVVHISTGELVYKFELNVSDLNSLASIFDEVVYESERKMWEEEDRLSRLEKPIEN